MHPAGLPFQGVLAEHDLALCLSREAYEAACSGGIFGRSGVGREGREDWDAGKEDECAIARWRLFGRSYVKEA